MKKRFTAVLSFVLASVMLAAGCYVSGLNINAASGLDVTVTENFAGGRINNPDYITYGSFHKDRKTVAPTFKGNNGKYSLKTAASTAWPDYLKADMRNNQLAYAQGKITVTADQQQWGITFKKDSSDNYHFLTLWNYEQNKMRFAYVSNLKDNCSDKKDWKQNQKHSTGNCLVDDGGTKPLNTAFKLGLTYSFKIEYNYSSNSIDFTFWSDEYKWSVTHTEELSDTDTPVCMFTSYAQSSPSYIEELTLKYGVDNTPSQHVDPSFDPDEDAAVQSVVQENFEGNKITQTDYVVYGTFLSNPVSQPKPSFENNTLKSNPDSKKFEYLKIGMKGSKLEKVTGKIYSTAGWWRQWRLVFKRDSGGNYHTIGVDLPESNGKEMRYLYSNTTKYEEKPTINNMSWEGGNGAIIEDSTGLTPRSDVNIKQQWLDFKMSYDYDKNTVTIAYTNPNIGWKCTKTYKLSDGDEPVCMFLSASDSNPAYLKELTLYYGKNKIEKFEEAVNAFPEVPDKTTPENAQALIAQYKSVLESYNKLSSAEKNKVSVSVINKFKKIKIDIQTLINNMNAESDITNGDLITFEYDDTSMLDFLNSPSNASYSVQNNPLKDSINPSNQVVELCRKDSLAVLGLGSSYIDGTSALKSFKVKLYVTTKNAPAIVYSYNSKTEWNAVAFSLDSYTGKLKTRYYRSNSTGGVNSSGAISQPYYVDPIVNHSIDKFDTKKGIWIDVAVDYDIAYVSLRINTENGLVRIGDAKYPMYGSYATRPAVVSFNKNEKCYFDDISYTFTGVAHSVEAQNFMDKYSNVFLLRASTVADIDKASIDGAVNEYNSFSNEIKNALPLVNEQLVEISAAYSEKHANISDKAIDTKKYWDTNSTYDVSADFESDASLGMFNDRDETDWNTNGIIQGYGASPEIVYSSAMKSNAVLLDRTYLTLKDSLLPEKGVHTKLEYDMCMKEGVPLRVGEDLRFMVLNNKGYYANIWNCRYETYTWQKRGQLYYVYNSKAFYNQSMLDPYEPMHFSITLTDSKMSITITQDYVKENGSVEHLEYSWNENISTANRYFAFGQHTVACYYDNIKITYEKGDFDIDEKNTKLNVMYSGNTVVSAGDTVSLEGENIYATVKKVEVQRVVDTFDTASAGFVSFENWKTSAIANGTYSKDPVSYTWNNAIGKEVTIVQKTEESIKFTLPNDIGKGIYAVKLFGYDGSELVIYLNAPNLEYYVGDEGKTVTAGKTLQIVGKNLAPEYYDNGGTDTKVYLKNKSTKKLTELEIEEVKSVYSLVARVPSDFDNGDYELWLYNGYGDSSCWSIPLNVKVADDIRSSWKKKFINIKDAPYSATGAQSQDATPLVIQAIEELYQAGGGTLYLPEGVYRLTQQIVIPENIIITGESEEKTNIFYTSYRWQYNEMPDFLIKVTSNVEISNITFYGKRVSGFIQINSLKGDKASAISENIYLEHVRAFFQPYAGNITSGGEDGSNLLVSPKEARLLVQSESVNQVITKNSLSLAPTENVQLKSCDLRFYGHQNGIFLEYLTWAGMNNHWQMDNVNIDIYNPWSTFGVTNSVISNVTNNAGNFTVIGENLYVDSIELKDNTTNNRELSIADLGGTDAGVGLVKIDDLNYQIKRSSASLKTYMGTVLTITKGMGRGQSRNVVKVTDKGNGVWQLTIDSPFVNPINRNSSWFTRSPRRTIYYVNSKLSNGAAGFGFYGGFCDVVIDSNEFDHVGGQYTTGDTYDVNWYYSYVNNVNKYDPYFFHVGVEKSCWYCQATGFGSALGYTFRNNDFGGLNFQIRAGVAGNAFRDLVIENNTFDNSNNSVSFIFGQVASSIDGVYIGKNYFTNPDKAYNDLIYETERTVNAVGNKRIIRNDEMKSSGIMGDIDCDGKVTIKDATLLRFYIIGKIELNEDQRSLADMDSDGEITIADVAMIRYKVLNG